MQPVTGVGLPAQLVGVLAVTGLAVIERTVAAEVAGRPPRSF